MTDTTSTLPLTIPQTEHSVIKHWQNAVEAETSLSCEPDTLTTNWRGVVLDPGDMSGRLDHNQLSFVLDNVGPRGMGGGFSPDIFIFDEAHHYDKRMKDIMGPSFVISDHCRPFFEETYKMSHNMPVKDWSYMAPSHKPGETPRGTKPSVIGGKKKSKQQRAAMKARRKQR